MNVLKNIKNRKLVRTMMDRNIRRELDACSSRVHHETKVSKDELPTCLDVTVKYAWESTPVIVNALA